MLTIYTYYPYPVNFYRVQTWFDNDFPTGNNSLFKKCSKGVNLRGGVNIGGGAIRYNNIFPFEYNDPVTTFNFATFTIPDIAGYRIDAISTKSTIVRYEPLSLAFLNYNYTSKRTLPNPLTPPVNLTYDRIQAATPNVLPDNSPLISGDESLEAVIAYSISPICSGTIPISAPILDGNTQINFANVNQGTTCSYSIPNLPPYRMLYNPPSPTNPNFLRPNPQLSISVLGSTPNAMSNTVSWIVSLQNASTDVAELAYIRLNNSPHIQFTMVESCQNNNCSGTLNQISISSNGYYNLGNIKNDGAHFYKITGTFNPCVIPYDANFEEIIPFEWGYFCSLSNLNAAPPTPCITNVAELRVKQARAELNNYTTGINNPTSYNSCGNYNFTSSVQSSNNGEVYDFDFEIILFPFMVLQSNWSVEIIQNNITTATYTNSNNPHNLSFIQISGTNNWAMDLSALNNELGASASNGLSLGNRINVTYGVELKCGYTGQYPSTLFNGISFCGESLSTNYPTYGWTYNTDGCNPACNNPCAHAPYGTPVINGNPGHSCVGSCYILTSPQLPCATLYNWTELNNINNPSLTFVTFTEFGNPTNTGRAITTTSNQVLVCVQQLPPATISGYRVYLSQGNTYGNTNLTSIWIRGILAGPLFTAGPKVVCPDGVSSCTYSVQNSVGAEIYEWSAPVNSIISANGISVTAPATLITSSTSVDIIFPTSFINNGSVSVSAGYLNCAYRSPVATRTVSTNHIKVQDIFTNHGECSSGICGGQTVNFNCTQVNSSPGCVGGNTIYYHWDVPGVAVTITGQGTSNPSITFPSNFGTAHVQVSAHDCPAVNFANLTGCHSSGSVIECLQVKSAPTIQGNISGPTNPCVSQTSVNYSIVSQCNTVATYDWIVIPSSMGTVVSGQGTENCNITFSQAGNASVNVKATNSCGNTTKTYSVTVGNCRISDSNENKSLSNIQIYPNPNDGTFNVTNCDANCQLEIYNSLGSRVGYTLVQSSETVKTLKVNSNSQGLFTIKITNSEGNFIHRFEIIR